MHRRRLLATGVALAASPTARATARRPAATPLRVGADRALVESGLGPALQRAFGADTGIAVKLVAGPALAVLDALKEGELDAALCNVPSVEASLDRQGLVHDRRPIAAGEFLLVGPAPKVRGKSPAAGRSVVETLLRLREQGTVSPDSLVFLSAGDGSGTHVAEQTLWRAAGVEPLAPWYVNAKASAGFVGLARSRGAYAVVERGAWAAGGGGPLAVLVDGDPLLAESVHAMRSFRASHPAGKIFVAWIAGGRGRAVVHAHRAYRAAT
jgi:tungstate transport system substrate-binding protein